MYLVFFATHIPVMLSAYLQSVVFIGELTFEIAVDLSGYYPDSLRPQFVTAVREYYKSNFRDRFFIDPPLWFHAYLALEIVYHIPLSIWATGALLRGTSEMQALQHKLKSM